MATIFKRGSRWAARVRVKGVSLSQSFVTKGQAQAWATQTEADILSGKYKGGTGKTLIDAIDRYLLEVVPKKKSRASETTMLESFKRQPFAELPLSKITTEMLAQFRDSELARVKASSVLRYLNLLSSVLETARLEWQWIHDNPAKNVKKPSQGRGRDRIFSDDEIERFVECVTRSGACTEIQRTIADVFLFAIETAMRASEIIGLEWSNIDGRAATLEDTKNNDKRIVPLSAKAVSILDGRRQFGRPFELKSHTLAVMFIKYCAECGIVGANFHDTRHTGITRMSKRLTPFELARAVGHRNMSQTLAYFTASADELADKLDG